MLTFTNRSYWYQIKDKYLTNTFTGKYIKRNYDAT